MGWIRCDRCGGKKVANYTPLCEECKFDDLATKMIKELNDWRVTGELPPAKPYDNSFPKCGREERIINPNPLDTQDINGD